MGKDENENRNNIELVDDVSLIRFKIFKNKIINKIHSPQHYAEDQMYDRTETAEYYNYLDDEDDDKSKSNEDLEIENNKFYDDIYYAEL